MAGQRKEVYFKNFPFNRNNKKLSTKKTRSDIRWSSNYQKGLKLRKVNLVLKHSWRFYLSLYDYEYQKIRKFWTSLVNYTVFQVERYKMTFQAQQMLTIKIRISSHMEANISMAFFIVNLEGFIVNMHGKSKPANDMYWILV